MKNINISNKAASPKQVRTYLRQKRGHAQEQDSRLLYSRPEIKPINFTNVSDLVECHECKKDVSLSAAINCTNFNCTKSYCLVCANKYPKEAFFNSCYFCKGICQCPSCVKNIFTGRDELVLIDKSLNFIDIRKSALDDDIIESLKPKKRNVQVIDIDGFEIIEDNQSQDSENFVEEIKEIPKDIDLSEDITSSANMNNFSNKYHGFNSYDNVKTKKKKKKQTQFSKNICSQFNNKGVANSMPSSIKEKTNNSIIIKIPNEKKLPFESESRINQILTRVCSNTALNPKYKTKKDCFICRQSNSISQYRFKCFTDFMVFLRQHFSINEYKSKSNNNVHLAVNIDNLNQYYKQYFLVHYTESSQQYKSVKYICHNCLESKMFIENGFFELYNLMLLSNIKMDLFSKSSGLTLNPNSFNNSSKNPNNVNFYVNNIKKNDNNTLINNNTINNNTSNANLNKTNIILNNNDANIINQITKQNLENSNLNIKPVVTTSTIPNNTTISNNKNKVSQTNNKNETNKINNNKETNKIANINNAESNTKNANKVNETDFSIMNNFNEKENSYKAPKEDTDMNNFNFSNNLNLAKDQESIEEQLKAIIIISQSLNLIKSKNDQPGAIQNFENELKEIIDQNPQLLNIIKTINEMYNSSKGHGNDLESQNQISESILMECLNNIGKDNGDTSFSNCLNILNQSNTNNNNINNFSNVNNHIDYNNPKNYNYNNANSLDNDEVKKLFYLQNFSNTATTEKPLSNEEIDTSLQQNLQNLLLNSLNNDNVCKNNEADDFQTLQKLNAIRGLQEDSNRIEQIQKLLQYAQMSDINIDNNTLTQLIMSTMTENDNNMHNMNIMNNNYGNMNDMNNLNNINFLNILMNQAQYEQLNNQESNVEYNDMNEHRKNKEDNDNNNNNDFENNCSKNNENLKNNNYSEKEIEDNKENESNKSNSKEESINDIKVADESEDVRKESNERKNSEEKKNESSGNNNKAEDFNNINSMVLNNLLTNFQNNSNNMNSNNANPDILDNVYNNLLSMNSNKVENEQVLNSFFKGMLNEWTGANNTGPSEHIDKQEVEILKETSNSFFNNIFNQLSNSNNNIAHNNINTTEKNTNIIKEEKENASNNTNNNKDADKKDDSTNDFFKKNMCFILDELKKQFFSIQYFSLLQKLYTSYIFKNLELFVDNITKYHSLSEIVANNIMVLCTGKDPMLTDYSHYLRNITYIGSNLSNALSVNLNNLKFNGIKIFNSLENSLKSNLKTVIENFEDAYNIIQDDNKNTNNPTNNQFDIENEVVIDLENKDIEIGRSYTRIRNNSSKMENEEENNMFFEKEKKSNITLKDDSENKPEIIIKDKNNASKMITEENKDDYAKERNISNCDNNENKGDNEENENSDEYDENTINMVDLPEEFRDD